MKKIILISFMLGFGSLSVANCDGLDGGFLKLCKQNRRILKKLNNVGSGSGQINICICEVKKHSSTDYDYYLKKNDGNANFTLIKKFTESDNDQGIADRDHCEQAKTSTSACYL